MSVAGDSVETTRLFYSAQSRNHGEQQNTRYYASHHRQTYRAVPNQTLPLHYGATPLVQDVRRQPIPPVHDERQRSRREEINANRTFCMLLGAITVYILVVLGILCWLSLGGQSSVPQFPVPVRPDELERYRKSGIYWDFLQPLECHDQYHYRGYTAQLQNVSISRGFDVNNACKSLPIEIRGHTIDMPDKCKYSGEHMHGYWTVYDPSDCTVEDEIQKYRNSGMVWDTPHPAPHCHSYDKREYEAHLVDIPYGYDWNKACRYIPFRIQNQVIEKPDSCKRNNSGQYGKWLVSEQLDCKPYWGPLKDVGCQATRKKRYEAPLWQLIEGDDWYVMCETTPATWNGRFYEHPTNCDYRGPSRGGMIGIWESESCS